MTSAPPHCVPVPPLGGHWWGWGSSALYHGDGHCSLAAPARFHLSPHTRPFLAASFLLPSQLRLGACCQPGGEVQGNVFIQPLQRVGGGQDRAEPPLPYTGMANISRLWPGCTGPPKCKGAGLGGWALWLLLSLQPEVARMLWSTLMPLVGHRVGCV